MKLYCDKGNFSPNVKRVRVLCNEVSASLEIVPLDFVKGERRRPEYLAKNPMGKVPTLDDDGYVIWESPAILFHIASKYPERELIPNDARGKTEMMRWLFWNASHLEPAVLGAGLEKIIKPMMNQPTDMRRLESWLADWDRYAPVLNAHLEGKTWAVGPFSIVDIALGTTIEFGMGSGLDVTKHAHLAAWFERVSNRDSWQRMRAT